MPKMDDMKIRIVIDPTMPDGYLAAGGEISGPSASTVGEGQREWQARILAGWNNFYLEKRRYPLVERAREQVQASRKEEALDEPQTLLEYKESSNMAENEQEQQAHMETPEELRRITEQVCHSRKYTVWEEETIPLPADAKEWAAHLQQIIQEHRCIIEMPYPQQQKMEMELQLLFYRSRALAEKPTVTSHGDETPERPHLLLAYVESAAQVGSLREVFNSSLFGLWLPEDNNACADLLRQAIDLYFHTREKGSRG